jgi:hypothetical protein
MARLKVDADEAFAMLVAVSQVRTVKPREVAKAMVRRNADS